VTQAVSREIHATHAHMRDTVGKILEAARSFAQTTALTQIDGPFAADTATLIALLDAITSNVDHVIEDARGRELATSLEVDADRADRGLDRGRVRHLDAAPERPPPGAKPDRARDAAFARADALRCSRITPCSTVPTRSAR
jgi:hypothetical protein